MTIDKRRTAQPGEFDTLVTTVDAIFPTVAGTATTTISLPTGPRLAVFSQACVEQTALIVPASGHCTVQVGKYDSTNSGAKVPLTAATNIDTATAKQTQVLPALGTLTDAQRYLQLKDTLYTDFVTTAAVTTQAVGGQIVAEMFIIK